MSQLIRDNTLLDSWGFRKSDAMLLFCIDSSTIDSIYIEKQKELPFPAPFECTAMLPLFSSTSCLTMVRPSPIPSWFIYAVRCNFPNLVNIFGKSSSSIPAPVSTTWTTRRLRSSRYSVLISIEPSLVNLRAFFTKLIRIYLRHLVSPISFFGSWVWSVPLMGIISCRSNWYVPLSL